jgi:DNA-binding NarL/FixJ family response regulator
MALVRTLIVEDSAVILENLIAALEELAEVRVVGSAADEGSAIGWIERARDEIDLLIVDIFLGSGSGLGVLRAAADRTLPAKRVVLTNYSTPEMRRRCASLGADRVFDKSRELEDLIAYCARLSGRAPFGAHDGP